MQNQNTIGIDSNNNVDRSLLPKVPIVLSALRLHFDFKRSSTSQTQKGGYIDDMRGPSIQNRLTGIAAALLGLFRSTGVSMDLALVCAFSRNRYCICTLRGLRMRPCTLDSCFN